VVDSCPSSQAASDKKTIVLFMASLPQPIRAYTRLQQDLANVKAGGLIVDNHREISLGKCLVSMAQIIGLAIEMGLKLLAGSGSCDESLSVLILHGARHPHCRGSCIGLRLNEDVIDFVKIVATSLWRSLLASSFAIYGVDVPFTEYLGKGRKRTHDIIGMPSLALAWRILGLTTVEVFATMGSVSGRALRNKLRITKENFDHVGPNILNQLAVSIHYMSSAVGGPALNCIQWHVLQDSGDAWAPFPLEAALSRPMTGVVGRQEPPQLTLKNALTPIAGVGGGAKYFRLRDVARDPNIGSKLATDKVARFLSSFGVRGVRRVVIKGGHGGTRARGRGARKGRVWAITARGLNKSLKNAFPKLLLRRREQ